MPEYCKRESPRPSRVQLSSTCCALQPIQSRSPPKSAPTGCCFDLHASQRSPACRALRHSEFLTSRDPANYAHRNPATSSSSAGKTLPAACCALSAINPSSTTSHRVHSRRHFASIDSLCKHHNTVRISTATSPSRCTPTWRRRELSAALARLGDREAQTARSTEAPALETAMPTQKMASALGRRSLQNSSASVLRPRVPAPGVRMPAVEDALPACPAIHLAHRLAITLPLAVAVAVAVAVAAAAAVEARIATAVARATSPGGALLLTRQPSRGARDVVATISAIAATGVA